MGEPRSALHRFVLSSAPAAVVVGLVMGLLAGVVFGLLSVLTHDDHVVRRAAVFAVLMGVFFAYQRVRERREHRLSA